MGLGRHLDLESEEGLDLLARFEAFVRVWFRIKVGYGTRLNWARVRTFGIRVLCSVPGISWPICVFRIWYQYLWWSGGWCSEQ